MRNGKLHLSPKHGVNAAIPLCFYCGAAKNEVILAGRLPGDQEAPSNAIWDRRPCETCRDHMSKGIIFISVRDGEEGDNPYRTGGWCVITEDAVRRILPAGALLDHVLRARVAFVPDETWALLGLPKGEKK